MDIVNFDALKAQGKIIDPAQVDPNEDYFLIGKYNKHYTTNNFKATNYPVYAIKAGDVMGGGSSFKFVKQFNYDGSAPIEIPYSEITGCKSIPEGCYPSGTTYNQYADYQIQLWQYIPFDPAFPDFPESWQIFNNNNIGLSSNYYVNASNGNVTLYFNGIVESPITFRLVILA